MNDKVSTIKPIQVRLQEKQRSRVVESAKKCHRSVQSEVVYRLELLQRLEDENIITIQ